MFIRIEHADKLERSIVYSNASSESTYPDTSLRVFQNTSYQIVCQVMMNSNPLVYQVSFVDTFTCTNPYLLIFVFEERTYIRIFSFRWKYLTKFPGAHVIIVCSTIKNSKPKISPGVTESSLNRVFA